MGILNDTKTVYEISNELHNQGFAILFSDSHWVSDNQLSYINKKGEIDMDNIFTKEMTERLESLKKFVDTPLTIHRTTPSSEPKTIGILDLWQQKQFSFMSDQYERTIDNLHKEDSLYKELYDLALQMATKVTKEHSFVLEKEYKSFDDVATVILKDIGESFALYTKDTIDKANTEFKKYVTDKERVSSFCGEIKTMLSACNTYEQEMEVLKSYNIVDKEGRLVVPTI